MPVSVPTIPTVPSRLGYTVDEAAALLSVSRRTVIDLIADGRLSSFTIGRGTKTPGRRISHRALCVFIEAGEHRAVVLTAPDR